MKISLCCWNVILLKRIQVTCLHAFATARLVTLIQFHARDLLKTDTCKEMIFSGFVMRDVKVTPCFKRRHVTHGYINAKVIFQD